MSNLLEQVGLTGGLLAALIFVSSLFLGERKKRRAAEVRGKASRENAASAVSAKGELSRVNDEKDKDVAEVDAWEKEEEAKIEAISDEVDVAAVKGGSSLANMWNKVMGRGKKAEK